MRYRDTMWKAVEEWSSVAFLLAGGLFVLPEVASGLNALTGAEIAVSPAAVFVFMLVVFVGLLGLYPRLADHDSTLAKGGVGLLALTAVTILPAIGVFVPETGVVVGEMTALAVVITVAVGSTLTVTTFGIASLRTGAHSRHVGQFLLVMAAGMSFMVVALVVYAHSTPVWVSPVANGLVAASLVSIGYGLRTSDVTTETPDATGDATAS